MYYVHKFVAIGRADALLFGDHSADLGEMARAGLAFPPGFWLGAEAYRTFLGLTQAEKTIERLLAGLRVSDPEDLEVRTEQIRNYLRAQQVPPRIAKEILQAYYELSVDVGSSDAPVPVALFASPASREIENAICSRPAEAFLNVSGEADLLDHVKQCWGTLWGARAVACRVLQGVSPLAAEVAVIVQAMTGGI